MDLSTFLMARIPRRFRRTDRLHVVSGTKKNLKKENLICGIKTIASVARVCWRPEHTHQLASCSLVHDSSIHVWDLRRQHVPVGAWRRADYNCPARGGRPTQGRRPTPAHAEGRA